MRKIPGNDHFRNRIEYTSVVEYYFGMNTNRALACLPFKPFTSPFNPPFNPTFQTHLSNRLSNCLHSPHTRYWRLLAAF